MADDDRQPIPFRMRHDRALAIVRRLAVDTAKIQWGIHAFERMLERDISDLMAVEVLRGGHIRGPIVPGRSPGEWKLKIARQIKGRRELGVIVVIMREERLFVKTVEWEDPT